MSIVTRVLDGVLQKQNDIRPPVTSLGSGGLSLLGTSIGGGGTNDTQQLNQMSAVAALFAVIDAIATAVASSEWHLYRRNSNGERIKVESHPAIDIWDSPNPFLTRGEFLEASAQHFDLAGAIYWAVTYAGRFPAELWPLRPDRVVPIPHPTEFISGYVYRLGSKQIPFEPQDIIVTKRPHPMSPYRGISPIESVMIDVASDRNAQLWTRNFFSNGAQPGGIISIPDEWSEEQFDKFRERWRASHQGVANSHRVALLEGGATWEEVKITQREMQFSELRRLHRDKVLMAYRVHKSIIGLAEDVNRANAEAAETVFSRWVIRPRLVRIKQSLNERLLPLFGDASLEFDFEDPAPDNQELMLAQATGLYTAGLTTRDESRERMGLPAADQGGDQYASPAPPLALSAPRAVHKLHGYWNKQEIVDTQLALPTIEEAEETMRTAWEKRLRKEVNEIIAVLTERSKTVQKIGLDDIDKHDWDWLAKYGDDVIEELMTVFEIEAVTVAPELNTPQRQRLAGDYARRGATNIFSIDGKNALSKVSRDRVRELTAQAITQGDSLGTLSRQLRADFQFSPSKTDMIARTETATALGQAGKDTATTSGKDQKRWITQGDDVVDINGVGPCVDNESVGWIGILETFPSGDDTIPNHPRCRCNVMYRNKMLADGVKIPEVRCPQCRKLLAKNVSAGDLYCDRCSSEVLVEAGQVRKGQK